MDQEHQESVSMTSDERWGYSENQQLGNVVQMMVPAMTCVEEGSNTGETICHNSTTGLSGDLHGVTSLVENNKQLEMHVHNESFISLPLASFLNESYPDCQFFNEIYHYLSSQTYPAHAAEQQKKIIRKRAASYVIDKDGILAYDAKNPKKIIFVPQEQRKLMDKFHIDETTGVHMGVRKMHQLLASSYFWRTMYVDIGTLVRGCNQCTESFPFSFKDERTYEANENRQNIWQKVHIKLVGPFPMTSNLNQYVMRLIDPASKFLIAESCNRENLEKDCAKFIFKTMCKFGFVDCFVSGMGRPEFEAVQVFYKNKVQAACEIMAVSSSLELNLGDVEVFNDDVIENFCKEHPDDWDMKLDVFVHHYCMKSDRRESPFAMMFGRCPLGDKTEEKNKRNSEDKTYSVPARRRLRSSTLQCRHCCEIFTSKISFRIHQRTHTEEARRRGTLDGEREIYSLLKSKGNVSKSKRKKKHMSRGGERLLTLSHCDWDNRESSNGVGRTQMTQSAVEAVKNLLQATKEERNKRGKYFKYTQELRDQIAKYAMDHSIPAASMYWSDRLGSTVSESSIRNFIKAYKSFSLSTKEEIGRYAYHNGLERAVVDCGQKLGCELRKGVVIKFKKLYMEKVCETNSNESISSNDAKPPNRAKRAYSCQMKDEIGRYAASHGIAAAIDYFSVKLQFPVKESTVRKFKRRFQDKHNEEFTQTPVTPQQNSSQNMEMVHPQLSVLGPSSSSVTVSSSNNFVYQHPYSINMAQPTGIHSNIIPMNSNLTFHQGGLINQSVTSLSYQQPPTQTVIMNQPFNPGFQQGYVNNFNHSAQNGVQGPIVAHTSLSSSLGHTSSPIHLAMGPPIAQLNPVGISPNHLGHNVQPSHHTQIPQHAVACFHQPNSSFEHNQVPNINMSEPLSLMKEQTETIDLQSGASHMQNAPTSHGTPIIQVSNNGIPEINPQNHEPQEINSTQHEEEQSPPPEHTSPPVRKRRTKKNYVKSSYTCGKRGNYGSYSPELRAEIGKYAMEHGNLRAMVHFKQKLGINIPESTIRGLKDKYLSKRTREEKEVNSLGFGQRGRPMRLGEYDAVVQDCIKELVKQGEKTGLPHVANPHGALRVVYDRILKAVQKMPEEAMYRKHTESIINEKLALVDSITDVEELDKKLAAGSIEMAKHQAEQELILARKLIEYQPWEPLLYQAPANQWKWPPN